MKTLKRTIPVLVCLILLASCTQRIDYLKELPSIKIMEGMVYYKGTPFTGELFQNDESGQLEFERNYKDGIRDGSYKQYFENGQLEMEGNYKDGKDNGLFKQYNENGQLKMEGNYKDGIKDGFFVGYFENGQLEFERNYKDGEKDGLYKQYYENGQLEMEGNYKDGDKYGLYKQYYENGQLEIKQYDIPYEEGYQEYYEDGYMQNKDEWYFFRQDKYTSRLTFNSKGDTIYWGYYKNDRLEGQSKTILNKQGDYSIVNYKNGKRVGRRTKFKANGKKIKEGITPLSEASLNEVTSSLRKTFYDSNSYHTSTLEILKNSKFRMTYNYRRTSETPKSIGKTLYKLTGSSYIQETTTKYDLIIEGDYIIYKTDIWRWGSYGEVTTKNSSRNGRRNFKTYYGYKIVFSGYDDYGKFHTMCALVSQEVFDNNQYQNQWRLQGNADGTNCERGNPKNREATIPNGTLKEL